MINKTMFRAAMLGGTAALSIIGSSAHAVTIGFEALNGFTANSTTTFAEAGYTFTYNPGSGGFAAINNLPNGNCGPPCAVNGTNIYQSFNFGSLTITKTSGGAFSASGFDAAQTFKTLNRKLDLTVSATTSSGPLSQLFTTAAGGADVFSTYALSGFGNVLSLTFKGGVAYPEVEFELDNIVLSNAIASTVPEPATWAMMLGGFGIVGGAMRYRRRRTAVSFG